MSNSNPDDGNDIDQRSDVARDVETTPSESGKWISAVVAVLGLWLLVQVVVFDPIAGNLWSDVIVGLALLVLGGFNYYRRADDRLGSAAVGGFVALLGLWLIATPFLLGAPEGGGPVEMDVAFWNDVVVGVLVFLLGAYSTYEARDTDVAAPTTRT